MVPAEAGANGRTAGCSADLSFKGTNKAPRCSRASDTRGPFQKNEREAHNTLASELLQRNSEGGWEKEDARDEKGVSFFYQRSTAMVPYQILPQ